MNAPGGFGAGFGGILGVLTGCIVTVALAALAFAVCTGAVAHSVTTP